MPRPLPFPRALTLTATSSTNEITTPNLALIGVHYRHIATRNSKIHSGLHLVRNNGSHKPQPLDKIIVQATNAVHMLEVSKLSHRIPRKVGSVESEIRMAKDQQASPFQLHDLQLTRYSRPRIWSSGDPR